MKWPSSFTFIRHGQSVFNANKIQRLQHPLYQEFIRQAQEELRVATTMDWPSDSLKELAKRVTPIANTQHTDYNAPLTVEGIRQAKVTGNQLKQQIPLPDIVYVSPYLRTKQTFESLSGAWSELKNCRMVLEERIREQEHGMSNLYNDPKLFGVFHPDQGLLSKKEGPYHYRFLNGESQADVRDRVRSFMSTVIREHAEENVLVVSHHLTLLSIRANLERWTPEQFMEFDQHQRPINCGVTMYNGRPEIGKEGKLVLERYNQKLY